MRLVFLAFALCGACTDEPELQIGDLIFPRDGSPAITAPPEVRVGDTAWVVFDTLGGACLSHHSTVVMTEDDAFVVTPYDVVKNTDKVCPLAGIPQRHEAALVFDAPGEATFAVRHRVGTQFGEEIVDLDVPITIR